MQSAGKPVRGFLMINQSSDIVILMQNQLPCDTWVKAKPLYCKTIIIRVVYGASVVGVFSL